MERKECLVTVAKVASNDMSGEEPHNPKAMAKPHFPTGAVLCILANSMGEAEVINCQYRLHECECVWVWGHTFVCVGK